MVFFRSTPSLLLLCLACLSASGQDTKKPIVLETFKVSRDGAALLVPVTFQGKTYQFLLDTGANFTVFDNSLPLGAPKRKETVGSPGGDLDVFFFKAPDAAVGKLKINPAEEVVGYDHTKMREVSGLEIYGVIGMDFLAKQVVQIDCDKGEVHFLSRVGPDAGKPIRMTTRDGLAFVEVEIQGHGKAPLLIDSGLVGPDSGVLDSRLLDELTKKGTFRTVGTSYVETLAGTVTSRTAQGKGMSLGEFEIGQPVFGEAPRNMLSMNALSRFIVTFDFPNEVMYLQKSKRVAEPDRWDISGLHLVRKQGQTVVHSVDKGSAAAARGILAGDKITQVGARRAQDLSMYEIRGLCCLPETTLDLVIERAGKRYSAQVGLKKQSESVAPK